MNIQLDLETTGTAAEDTITVVGYRTPERLEHNETLHAFYLKPENHPSNNIEVTSHVTKQLNNIESENVQTPDVDAVNVKSFDTEKELLKHATKFIEGIQQRIAQTVTLVGYNSHGFDLPLLRTRLYKHNLPWNWVGLESQDIQYLAQDRFNTTIYDVDVDVLNKNPKLEFGNKIGADVNSNMYVDELTETIENHGYTEQQLMTFLTEQGMDTPQTTQQSLDGIFDVLTNTTVPDPFDDSAEAVTAFEDGNVSDVVVHNLLDVWKTYILTETLISYINETEFRTHRL